jgi:hypothetical protein
VVCPAQARPRRSPWPDEGRVAEMPRANYSNPLPLQPKPGRCSIYFTRRLVNSATLYDGDHPDGQETPQVSKEKT